MLPLNQNEIAALQLVLQFTNIKELLISAQAGFDEQDTINSHDKADLCWKAVQVFLR